MHPCAKREKSLQKYTSALGCMPRTLCISIIVHCNTGSRKEGSVGLWSKAITNFGSHFGLASQIAADNKWLPAKHSYQKWRLPAKTVFIPKIAINGETKCNIKKYLENYIYNYFLNNFESRTSQPVLVRSQPFLLFSGALIVNKSVVH